MQFAHVAMVEIAPGVSVPGAALRLSFVRSDGPGGQNVNKRSTKAQLRVSIGDLPLDDEAKSRLRTIARSLRTAGDELIIADGRRRSQRQNAEACMERLARLIETARRAPTMRRATRPGKGAVMRRLEGKSKRGDTKKLRRPPPDA